jgi:hypothetical protein
VSRERIPGSTTTRSRSSPSTTERPNDSSPASRSRRRDSFVENEPPDERLDERRLRTEASLPGHLDGPDRKEENALRPLQGELLRDVGHPGVEEKHPPGLPRGPGPFRDQFLAMDQRLDPVGREPEGRGKVRIGIQVHQQDPLPRAGEDPGQ